MLITIKQNKAHQTVAVMGSVDNALKAALSKVFEFCQQYAHACAREGIITKILERLNDALKVAVSEFREQYAQARARGAIIAKNLIKPNIHSNNLSLAGVGSGYNGGSKKLGSTQRLYRCIFVPPFMAVRFLLAHGLHSMGVWVRSNPPADLVRLEHPHLIGGFKSKKLGGSNA